MAVISGCMCAPGVGSQWRLGMSEKTETVTVMRAEYERLRARSQWYESRYEADAAEMRRMINQAHEQLSVSVREIQQLQARVRELEAVKHDDSPDAERGEGDD